VFKQIGKLSGVETEPDILSEILDKITDSIEKVYYAVCPGAGGFDAICLLVETSTNLSEINELVQ
jgi:phosphomevalonate kinase